MSLFDKYLTGWQFRTTTPQFEPGEVISLIVTDYDNEADVAVARVGDSRVHIENTQPGIVDMKVKIEITDFDDSDHVATAELVEIIGETMY